MSTEIQTRDVAENHWVHELKKCIESPYYFAKTYITINGKPYQTSLSEKEFNEIFKKHL